jgi:formylmethanofuran dehydrogenase subunit E
MTNLVRSILAALVLCCATTAHAETPEEWVKLGARVHGGFGSFIPVGIRIGEDAMTRLDTKPRELAVVFYQGEGVPCPCSIDGVMLAIGASPGQGSASQRKNHGPAPSRW